MMPKEITVKVNTEISVSDETAECCLKLLEMWQRNNPEKEIIGKRIETLTGEKTIFRIVDRKLKHEDIY